MECAQTVGIDLPLKALVWEDSQGQVWLGYNDPAFLAQRHGVVQCPVVLASQGSQLPQVALLMGLFGVGAALPIVVLAYVSRGAMLKMRGKLMQAGKTGKMILGVIMMALAVLILSGADKPVETWLVNQSPAWLTQLTTRF